MKHKIFLGGTCAETDWRDKLIPILKSYNLDYFNPIVDNWNEDCINEENRQKEELCDIHLYYINNEMKGVYSIAEAIESVHNKDKITIFVVNTLNLDYQIYHSLKAVGGMVRRHGGIYIVDERVFMTNLGLDLKRIVLNLDR